MGKPDSSTGPLSLPSGFSAPLSPFALCTSSVGLRSLTWDRLSLDQGLHLPFFPGGPSLHQACPGASSIPAPCLHTCNHVRSVSSLGTGRGSPLCCHVPGAW